MKKLIQIMEKISPSSTIILGNKVSINIFDDNVFIILIESKSVANSYRKYFEYLWDIARK